MKRSILSALLTAILLLGLTACGGKAEPTAEAPSDAPLAGGWAITGQTAAALPESVQAAFDKAAGENLVPVALLAQQVVAGTNDMLFCQKGGEYRVIVIYRDLQGGASFTGFRPIDPAGFNQ